MYGACVLATGCIVAYLVLRLVLAKADVMCNCGRYMSGGVQGVFCLCVKTMMSGWPR